MPTINPTLVPTIAPGSIFEALTTNDVFTIRWLTQKDPAYFGVLNRPLADLALRQLIIAKAIDQLNSNFGHTALFPFLIQPRIASGSGDLDLPVSWLWDVNLSFPAKWENIRLAKIKRISGVNDGAGGYTGALRLIFAGTQQGSAIETGLVYADYDLESTFTYQIARITAVGAVEESVHLDSSEAETVTGFVVFKTLDRTDSTIQNFLNVVEEPDSLADLNNNGVYDTPAVYELIDAVPDDSSGDFSSTSVSHGSGLLAVSAHNPIPALDSDVQSWINAFNYPFDAGANRTSTASVIIPLGLFREFNITAPAGDEPTGDTSGTFFPVWIARIERIGNTTNQIRMYFATYNVTDTATGGTPSTEPIEFATLDLTRDMIAGEVVDIVPSTNLHLKEGTDAAVWGQHLGRGHVVLSSLWGGTSSAVDDFFDVFGTISDDPADTVYSKTATRLSSFGISRIPKYTPTIGQAQALLGSSARRTTAVHPSIGNRYVTESDQGLGDSVDLEAQGGITPHIAIERTAYKGSLCHRIIKLVINSTLIADDEADFFEEEVRPRLRIVLGRDLEFGDMWHNGTRVAFWNGDTFQSLG